MSIPFILIFVNYFRQEISITSECACVWREGFSQILDGQNVILKYAFFEIYKFIHKSIQIKWQKLELIEGKA